MTTIATASRNMKPTPTFKNIGDRIATAAFWTVVAAIGWAFTLVMWRAAIPRHQLVDAFLGVLLIVAVLTLRWWILRVTNKVKIYAPEQYGYVEKLGKALFLAVVLSALFVQVMMRVLLHNQHFPILGCLGVILAAFCGWRATLCWRYVWHASVVLRVFYKRTFRGLR